MDVHVLKRMILSERVGNNYKSTARLVLLRKSSAYNCWGCPHINENG